MNLNFADLIISADDRFTKNKMPFNIFLTGFMGAGKTSVGKQLASLIGVCCYDTDEIIAAASGMSISELFSTKGELFFRNMESELLKLLGEKPPGSCIVSTGGGAVLRQENISAMRKNGVIVLLQVTAEEIGRRINGNKNRPLLMTADPLKSLKELLEKRKLFYSKSDLVTETSGLTISETVNKVIKAVEGWNNEKK
jgi:shikimate kinase